MNVARYSVQMPDPSRNMSLAGKTVSSNGMNVTYDEDGFVVCMTNYNHELLKGTAKSVRAPSKDAVLNANARASFVGSSYDRQFFSDKQIELVEELRHEVASGMLSQTAADRIVESVREQYGYSGGATGYDYVPLQYYHEPGELYLEQQAAQNSVYAQSITPQSAPVDSAAVQSVSAEAPAAQSAPVDASAAEAPAVEPPAASVVDAPLAEAPSAVFAGGGVNVGMAQSAPAAAVPVDRADVLRSQAVAPVEAVQRPAAAEAAAQRRVTASDAGRSKLTRQLYQDALMQQQQSQLLHSALREQRRQEVMLSLSKSRIADRLLRLMDSIEEEENKQKDDDPIETLLDAE